MTPLEQATQAAVAEQQRLKEEVRIAWQDQKAAQEREAVLKGKIEVLECELAKTKERSDHYLQWAVETTKQLHNVGLFVSDALHLAREEVSKARGDGKEVQSALTAVEKALGVPPLQISDNQVRR